MHSHPYPSVRHDHTFGQDRRRPGESRTVMVIGLTATMMVVEIAAGIAFGSMVLLADGLHMASHAVALCVNVFAYVYARRYAGDPRYSFGTGKVNALGGFSGAVLLAVFCLLMAAESFERLLHPVAIVFDQAILVAVIGLVVNGLSAAILGARHTHEDELEVHDHHHDHNLRSAYLHVLADALTSVFAIAALLAGKYLGLSWMDPVMGFVGAVLVGRWSVGLLRSTSLILLDRQGSEDARKEIEQCIQSDGDSKVTDLHLWCIGPGIFSLVMTVVARDPATPDEYRERLPKGRGLAHVSIEVQRHADEAQERLLYEH
ncbi:MAG: CDF family Co(II)/Ni(II) efflux transporter DmeF [Candidatus Krumholzibacteria bacterium]|nr:CDF family Co(II)/Ni(II) efflux transporter DmeF [Candidatus Krumholzibacteria bacterium]MDH4335876.1 CDF family Co(II)/Ni(II) efflux transporter DmeF [Candidatus Krumholzibacteria bacterium]MDH5270368.1 CDF family Co(II)/Ni(II) efflux transporter DmeF [Candidatus Krumholzibacteria bacterium]